MAQVEINHIAARRRNGVAFAPLVPESLRDFIARAEFHVFVFRLAERRFRPHTVILQVAIAVFIHQNTAFAAAAFGHQDPRSRQAGWVILDKLHVAQRDAVAQRHAHAIAGDDAAVGVIAIDAASAAGSHDDRIGANLHQRAFHHIHCHQAAGLAVIDENIQHEVLVETLNLRELEGGLEEGMQHMEAGFIGGEPSTFDFHPAEAANVDAAIRAAAPRATPQLKLGHFRGAVMYEIVYNILFTEPVAAGDGVVKMVFKAIVILRDRRRTAFGGDGMATHWIDF